MGAALKYKQSSIPQQVGEVARLKVVRGSEIGALYVLKSIRSTIGRGEENDVVLADLKSSRKHAEFSRDQYGVWSVRDLGSANGIVHNGATTRQATIKKGDTIVVGDTLLEFIPAPVLQLAAPSTVSQPQIAGISTPAATNGNGGLLDNLPPEKRRMLIYAVVGIGLWFFLDGDTQQKPSTAKAKDKKEEKKDEHDLSNYLPGTTGAKTDAAETFFRAGFREFREKNYLRAKIQFETALQISPYHRLASLYLKHCERSIEEEVSFHLVQGNKSKDSGKLKSAKGHFEAVLRLLYRDVENPHYIEAKDQLKVIQMKMKGGLES